MIATPQTIQIIGQDALWYLIGIVLTGFVHSVWRFASLSAKIELILNNHLVHMQKDIDELSTGHQELVKGQADIKEELSRLKYERKQFN